LPVVSPRVSRRRWIPADLISYGIFGLIDAIEKYDLERGIKFETYASLASKGAIIDELRAMDWVPRSVRSRAREIEGAYVKLENNLKRVPSDAEVAAELGIAVKDLHDIFTKLSYTSVVSFEELWVGGRRTTIRARFRTIEDLNADNPVEIFESAEVKEILGGRHRTPAGAGEDRHRALLLPRGSPLRRSVRCSASPNRESASCTPRPF